MDKAQKPTSSGTADQQLAAAESEGGVTVTPHGAAEEPAEQMHSHQSAGATTRPASATVSRKQAKKEAKQRKKMENKAKNEQARRRANPLTAEDWLGEQAQRPTPEDLANRLRLLVRKDTNNHVILNDCEGELFGNKLGDDYKKTVENWVLEGGDVSKVDFDGMRAEMYDDFKAFMMSGHHTQTEADKASVVTLKDLNGRLMDLYQRHQALNVVDKDIIRKDSNAVVAQWLAEAGGRYSPQQWGAEVAAVRKTLVQKYGSPEPPEEVFLLPAAEREREEILKKFYNRCRDELKAYWKTSMDDIAAGGSGGGGHADPQMLLDECFASLKPDRDNAIRRGVKPKKLQEIWGKAKDDFLQRPVSKKHMDAVAQRAKERITNGEDPNLVLKEVLEAMNE